MPTDVTVFGVTYDLTHAPTWVRFGINRWLRRYNTNYFDVTPVPRAVRYYVNLLCKMHGVRVG